MAKAGLVQVARVCRSGSRVGCGVEPAAGPYARGKFVLFATGDSHVGYRVEANYVRLVRGGSPASASH
jgi:hypothetical protein